MSGWLSLSRFAPVKVIRRLLHESDDGCVRRRPTPGKHEPDRCAAKKQLPLVIIPPFELPRDLFPHNPQHNSQLMQQRLLAAQPTAATAKATCCHKRACCRRRRAVTAAAAGRWYESSHAEELRAVLQLPPYRFQTFIAAEPAVLDYQAATLAVTLAALSESLHTSHKAVVQVLEQRPGILLQPTQPISVLRQLAALTGRNLQQTAFLLAPHPQLLALPPQQLGQRVSVLAELLQLQPQDDLAAAIGEIGAPAFLLLLASPVHQTRQQLADLANALDASPSTAAALAQHHPHLLGMSPAVLRSRLFALADAAGVGCGQLLEQLDQGQVKGLSSLLLLSPGRLLQQLSGLEALLEGRAPRAVAVRLLLRLGTRVSLPEAQVMMVALQGVCRHAPAWQQQLLAASDRELAVLLSASHKELAQAMFLAASRQADACGLIEVVTCSSEEFRRRHGMAYSTWLAGKGVLG